MPAERAAALVDCVTATRATFTTDVQRAAFHKADSRAIALIAPGGVRVADAEPRPGRIGDRAGEIDELQAPGGRPCLED